MDLTSDIVFSHNSFLSTLTEDKKVIAWEGLNFLLTHQIYPILDQFSTVADLQRCEPEYLNDRFGCHATYSNLYLKFNYIGQKVKKDDRLFCMAILFMVRFYLYILEHCPDFKIPVGEIDSEMWIEYTVLFAAVSTRVEKIAGKPGVELLKEFFQRIVDQSM